jgi:hypothetical protein
MARFYGVIGYEKETVENKPGIWEERYDTRSYFGDVLRHSRRLQTVSDQVNDNIVVSNEISIVADPYALTHFHSIRYVEYSGVKWKVANVMVQPPRLILTLGDVFNE